MALKRTTEIDLTDDAKALVQYNDLLFPGPDSDPKKEKIVMVILGDSDSVPDGLKLADKRARQIRTNFNLWVMYIGNHTTLKAQLEPYLLAANIIKDDTPYEEVKAFCLSLAPRVAESNIHLVGQFTPLIIDTLFREAIENSPTPTNA